MGKVNNPMRNEKDSNYDRLVSADEMRLIGRFFCNVDEMLTDANKTINHLKNVKTRFMQLMFPSQSKNKYHYL